MLSHDAELAEFPRQRGFSVSLFSTRPPITSQRSIGTAMRRPFAEQDLSIAHE